MWGQVVFVLLEINALMFFYKGSLAGWLADRKFVLLLILCRIRLLKMSQQ